MKYGIANMSGDSTFGKSDAGEEMIGLAPESEPSTMANPSREADAVIFSIQFYGKTIGEVGMMDQDLSELDWKKFKSYLFQNLLSVNQQENICVSYSDEEGDKLPIESDEEYQEALKVAKKKAEMHDKLVLDITRQGGFPAVLSLVSSGIKRVSSSPPKEGGISFFKASSPPKDGAGFKNVGVEKKLFQGFFMPDKGPIPGHVQGVWGYDCDEALECGKVNTSSTTTTTTTSTTTPVPTARTDCKRGPPVRALRNSPPNLLFNFETPNHNLSTTIESSCQDVFGAGVEKVMSGARCKEGRLGSQFSERPPEWFTSYMSKFRAEICDEVTDRVVKRVETLLRPKITFDVPERSEAPGLQFSSHVEVVTVDTNDEPQRKCPAFKIDICEPKFNNLSDEMSQKEESDANNSGSDLLLSGCDLAKKKDDKNDKTSGAKRKKVFAKEVEREERLIKKHEKIERKKFLLTSKYADEMDKASRTQEKVFAKMEGLRKKQQCSPEELSKLRKMVNKQQRLIAAEQKQQRCNERKAGHQKLGKGRKISLDNKCFPVDASLLRAALQELEALAEDSSDITGGAATRGFDATYLKDVTYPDGSVVSPGKEFIKTWRVANNGVMPWNEKTVLCKWSQVRIRGSPAGWKLKPSMKRFVCPPLEPGQEGDISITFTSPNEPGWYATHWRFCQRGRVFGNQMWCAIRVEEEQCTTGMAKLEKTVIDENGVTTHSLTKDDMQDLSKAIMSGKVREPLRNNQDHPLELPKLIPPREELVPQSDLGIVENYYDAEDPVQRECTESLQILTLSSKEDSSDEGVEEKEKDLITFEEEAEILESGTSTPEMIPSASQTNFVIPLKEMAKESVESLIIKDQELRSQLRQTEASKLVLSDSISVSSGSFSELDSEDQAILNESDSEISDHEYYVVHLPDCFNVATLRKGIDQVSDSDAQPQEGQGPWRDEIDRPESPDFLTADEDDRTTAVASDSSDDLTCPVNDHDYVSRSSSSSQASASANHDSNSLQTQVDRNDSSSRLNGNGKEEQKDVTAVALPEPPTETKPFMTIPNEAIKASLMFSTSQIASNGSDPSHQPPKDQDSDTWATDASTGRNVVCEQPYSAQHKEPKKCVPTQNRIPTSVGNEKVNGSTNPSQLPVDLVGALPDELVSIIPEDLVRGAWNTARSFITRINQEMLSPTSESSGHVFPGENESPTERHQSPPPSSVPESEPQRTEVAQENVSSTAVGESRSPLVAPMQQLEDMGFHNPEVNKRLLAKYSGDISCAVAELIVLDCQ